MSDHQAAGGPGEASIGDQRNGFTQTCADDRCGDAEHLPHPGTAGRTFIPGYEYVVGLDHSGSDGGSTRLFTVEHACGADMTSALGARELGDAPVRRQIAAQDMQRTTGLNRMIGRENDIAVGLHGVFDRSGDGGAGDGGRVAVEMS